MQTKTSANQTDETVKLKDLTRMFCYNVRIKMRAFIRLGKSNPTSDALRHATSFAYGGVTVWQTDEALLLAAALFENANAHPEAVALAIRKIIDNARPQPIMELSQGEPEFRAAVEKARKSHFGLVSYKHGVGFGHGDAVFDVDWAEHWSGCRFIGFIDVRSFILDRLNNRKP